MEKLIFYYPEGHEGHAQVGHPERPERVWALRQALEEAGWWQVYPKIAPQPFSSALLTQVHSPHYLESLQAACRQGLSLDADTYTRPASWELARNSAGGAIAIAQAVWKGSAQRGFALTRPPGHHATRERGMGFCLLNNIALAAQSLLSAQEGDFSPPQRLAIVDLDLHHGNGTQDIFWLRKDVLFISTHQSPLYPGTGRLSEIGSGEGEGYTVNIPLPPYSGDNAYQTAMETIILPLLDRFAPQMVLVSFGFDPHWRDPLGSMCLSAKGYGRLLQALVAWADGHCQGKLAVFLEGGYDLEAAKACGQAVVAALLGEPWEDPLGPPPYSEGRAWQETIQAAKRLWHLIH